ncbi:hypothetical protein K2173_012438 [Erythroxylum novogranatense]|uniref:Phorbol-ester/DAG-type domain-containing protein n=1 Tax=Erythroxylum novogranatense TaxID=1862640 RepID=A0AAV8TJN8_9ROSI|nr:hypothetical protein K2173_012438 [Erythroxylum novogranatense]
MEIQFEHDHVLTFCDQNKENFSHILLNERKADGDLEFAEFDYEEDYPSCLVCLRKIDDGPVYFCEMCDGIWVHKFCASLPREIRAHPLHLQHGHPLTLLPHQTDEISLSSFNGKVNICDGCRDITISGNYYACAECGLKLDVKCALSLQVTIPPSPDTKTSIPHHSYDDKLLLFNFNKEMFLDFGWNRACELCEKELLDLTYGCFYCQFYLHKRCLEITQQECLILPIHSHHPLSIEYCRGLFICDQCRDLCGSFYRVSFMAICKECGLKFDYKCASISDTTDDTIQRSIKDEVKTQIRYFDHDQHMLSFFNLRRNFRLECEGWGLLILSGPSYGCLECEVYLHKSCAELPRGIQHPYHRFHNLFPEKSEGYCRACRKRGKSLRYRCHLCPSFLLDTECVINNLGVISALKNKEYHQHDLYYFVAPDSDRLNDLKFECHNCSKNEASFCICRENCEGVEYEASCYICWENCEGAFYICLECNSYFHMECIGIPKEVKHDSHLHPLTLMDPLTEDKIDESKDQYYCYTCEEKRNPRYHAYSCQQCAKTGHMFTSHIECVLSSELNEIEHNHMIKEDDEEENNLEKFPDLSKLSISPRCMRQLLIKDKFNDHVLNYFEDIIDFSCYLCKELVQSPCYECSFCQIHLHKECAKLPSKIKHNLHGHPLSITGGEFLKTYICDGCHVYHEKDMCYYCEECSFFLDKMCAQMIPSIGNHYPKLNDNGSKVEFSHFSHNHKLKFAFIPKKLEVNCSACGFLISGPTYCCYACYFFLHESCCYGFLYWKELLEA